MEESPNSDKRSFTGVLSHPAVFSEGILKECGAIIDCYWREDRTAPLRVLDPFAGVGNIHNLPQYCSRPLETFGLEIEAEWANVHTRTEVGDATMLPYNNNSFDAVVTSPTYGNRMADHHEAKDDSTRRNYRVALGRDLSEQNTGRMQWGDRYREVHRAAWEECYRVMRLRGLLILNLRDHIRAGKRVPVAAWHIATLVELGFELRSIAAVGSQGYGFGANSRSRVGTGELVVELAKVVW